MSISLKQLSDKVNSMGIETWYEYWNPESKTHNEYQLKRTDFDFMIGFVTIWDINNNRNGQLVPVMALNLDKYKWDGPDGHAYQNNEAYYVQVNGQGLITTHQQDAIWRLIVVAFKFHGLKIYYIFRYNIYNKIILRIISSLRHIFTSPILVNGGEILWRLA